MMKVVVYFKLNSGVPAMAMCVKNESEVINFSGYTRYVIDPNKIVDTLNQPVSLSTFFANFDKFEFDGVDTLKQSSNLAFDNRKINTLSTDSSMSIGRSNTETIFSVL